MAQVDAVRTPATAGEVIGAIMAAGVSRTAANIIAAQSADETAAWKAMYNWNPGNLTASGSQNYDIESSSNPGHFQSFSSLKDGAAAMVNWLAIRGALPYAENADVAGYVGTLAANGYLGRIGSTDQTGHVISQLDYDNYQAAIQSYLPQMQAAVAVSPPWGFTKTVLAGVGIAALTYAVMAAEVGEAWTPRWLRRLVQI